MKKSLLMSGLVLSALTLTACSSKETAVEQSTAQSVAQSVSASSTSSIGQSSEAVSATSSSSSDAEETSQTDERPETSTSLSSEDDEDNQTVSEQVETTATFNGSYYSVQGKYGEVLIVNKKHGLSAGYGYGEDPTALAAFQSLLAEMRGQGFSVSDAYSGFRSYDTQSGLYNNYVARDGQAAADRYSARPGYSEHQTGLAFDVIDGNGNLLEEPAASQWLLTNAHKYGFIVRYLSGKEQITGYMAEPWHLRYIGAEATDIAQSGLTLEEYFGIPGGDYSN